MLIFYINYHLWAEAFLTLPIILFLSLSSFHISVTNLCLRPPFTGKRDHRLHTRRMGHSNVWNSHPKTYGPAVYVVTLMG
ncbi:hypothetical protein L1987_47725 [Smallanthus sonchifolius]|uniref:Uncharacterized protein n=1 Tax=Smallanthus sonchifolius TaxID=185202 RepID=A0ACB9G3E0_9ASTR|nr:hypothetical protein L1987_47725 [Smallanthus sonchifolius]